MFNVHESEHEDDTGSTSNELGPCLNREYHLTHVYIHFVFEKVDATLPKNTPSASTSNIS
jgi:hypothetical protein